PPMTLLPYTTLCRSGDDAAVATAHRQVRGMLAVLGLDPLAEQWSGADTGDGAARRALSVLVDQVVTERAGARAAKDFARADELRDRLTAAGVVVEDGADGARWSLRGGHDGR